MELGAVPKTVKGYILQWLFERGLFEEWAEEVFELARVEIEKTGRVTWDQPVESYPKGMYAVMILIVKRCALAWIDEKHPEAWFRPMFTDEKV